MAETVVKIKLGKYLYPLTMKKVGGHYELSFPYDKSLIAEIKCMEGARWHGFDDPNPRKIWTIKDSPRNRFQLDFLSGGNPYAIYDIPLVDFTPNREICYYHQVDMSRHMITRKQCVVGCEMGTGKTLAAIEAMEASGLTEWFWVGPKSALYSVQLEFDIWKAKVRPRFYTYEALKRLVDNWPEGKIPPQGIVIDESSRCKNPTAQRSQACYILANMIRDHYGDENAWVIEMSGSPSPKDPGDWWMQSEIARPGYLKEGNLSKFKQRLAIIEQRESISGGVYPHLVTWKDSEDKCNECGKFKTEMQHDLAMGGHSFVPSFNEVAYLYKRLSGLVMVKFKKDCLDLPEKRYVEITLKPSQEIVNIASLITAKSPSTIQALTLLRELSDGFQYQNEELGNEECPLCHGTCKSESWVDADEPDNFPTDREIATGTKISYDEQGNEIVGRPIRLEKQEDACMVCSATGRIPRMGRTVKEIPTPKEDALKDLLDQHEELGRIVIYGGFTGTIDRIVAIVKRAGWDYVKADGRGWDSSLGKQPMELLKTFQKKSDHVEKMAFIGQPSAAGMGLNLTASPSIVYWSNDFNAESRIQSEDRIHRPGMDVNRGATIYDLIHLPADLFVLTNLKRKKRLQDMSMGVMREEIAAMKFGDMRYT